MRQIDKDLISLALPRASDAEEGNRSRFSDDGWQALFERSQALGVGPLVGYRMMQHSADAGPRGAVMAACRAAFFGSTARNVRIQHELSVVGGLFREAQISFAFLKGAYLAYAVYPEPGCRPMSDVDVLIQRDDIQTAYDTLRKKGWREGPRSHGQSRLGHHHHLPALYMPGSLAIELHWNIVDPYSPFSVDPEGLWQRSIPSVTGHRYDRILAPEDILLHLCLHAGYSDRFLGGLRPLVDIRLFLDRCGQGGLDWDKVLVRAGEWGAARCAAICLSLVERLFGKGVPDPLVHVLEKYPMVPEDIVDTAEQLVLTPPGDSPVGLPPNFVRIMDEKGLARKMKVLARVGLLRKAGVRKSGDQSRLPRGYRHLAARIWRNRHSLSLFVRVQREAASGLQFQRAGNRLSDWMGGSDW